MGQKITADNQEQRRFTREKAIKLFLNNQQVPHQVIEALHKYIEKHMRTIQCCVLWTRSDELVSILTNAGVPQEAYKDREVILTSGYDKIQYYGPKRRAV